MSAQLTEAQRNVFVALLDMMTEEGRSPTLRELGKRTGIRSSNGVLEHVIRLRNKGMLEPAEQAYRNLEVADRGWDLWAEILSKRAGRTVTAVEAEILTLTSKALRRRGGVVEVIAKTSDDGSCLVAIRVAASVDSAHDGESELTNTLSA